MPFFSSSSPFDAAVEKATAANNTTEDWTKIMDICDQIPRSPSGPKDALTSILKRVNDRIPHVSLQALTLLDACVNNCGKVFHLEVCSRDFVGEVRNSLNRIHPTAALKFKGLIREWAKTFKDDPQLVLIPTLYEELKREKEQFPDEKTLRNIGLSSDTKPSQKSSSSNEADDLALAIRLSLNETESSKQKISSLYPSISSGSSSSPSSSTKRRKVRALYDFEAAEDNEMTFKTADIITVTDSSDANWWKGEFEGQSGLFPANFVTTDLTPEPKPVKKKSKKKKKKVSFSEKNSVKEFQASDKISQMPVISEEKIEECLELLKNRSMEDEDEDDEYVLELEERCKKMESLITGNLNNIQTKLDSYSEVNHYFVQVMETYQTYCKEPLPQTYSANAPRTINYNKPTTQHSYNPYIHMPYQVPVPEMTNPPYSGAVVHHQPVYAAQLNQPQYLPQFSQAMPYQPPETLQDYDYTVGQVPPQFHQERPPYTFQPQYQNTTQYQQNYPTAVPGPYDNDSYTQLVAAQSRY